MRRAGGGFVNIQEIRRAYQADEILEYHAMGVEHGIGLLPGPDWYPCYIIEIYPSGNVEIELIGDEVDGVGVTVLERNIPIAFRRLEASA